MNTRLILVLVVLLLLIGAAAWFFASHRVPGSNLPGNQNPFATTTTSGNIGVGTPTLSIQGTDGSTYQVPDFTAGKPADTLPAGTYYHVTSNQETQGDQAQFEMVYGTDNSVTIGLIKEPLGQSRLAAEAALRAFFPLSNAQLCKLNVFVSVPASVNDTFAGNNLGLSFCPGATKLP